MLFFTALFHPEFIKVVKHFYKPVCHHIISLFVPIDIPENYFAGKATVPIIKYSLAFLVAPNTAFYDVVNIFQWRLWLIVYLMMKLRTSEFRAFPITTQGGTQTLQKQFIFLRDLLSYNFLRSFETGK